MKSVEAQLREQLVASEAANSQLLKEIKQLQSEKTTMRNIVRNRRLEVQVDTSHRFAGCRDVFLDELTKILKRFEELAP